MKHAVIVSHPVRESFTLSVAGAYAAAAAALGHQVLSRDLYRMNFDPRLGAAELPLAPGFAPAPDAAAERQLLAGADVFALIYPLWLDTPPAMLKGYLERVFGYGFAYGGEGGTQPLLTGRRLIVFTSSGAPLSWMEETGAFAALRTLFDDYFAQVCGLTLLEHVHVGGVVPDIRADWVAARLADVRQTVKRHFAAAR